MALPARTKRAMTSSGLNPTWGLMIVVAAQSAAVISALRTVDFLSPFKAVARCVSRGALCYYKCAHVQGCLVAPCLIDSLLTQCFCVVERTLMKVAAAQVVGEALVAWVGCVPRKNLMSRRVKGVNTVSVTPAQYSPGQKRKKNVIQARFVIAFPLGDPPWATESIKLTIQTGRVRILPGGGSSFV